MRYKDWIKVGQMTDKEVLNDIEMLVGALKGEYGERDTFQRRLAKENRKLRHKLMKLRHKLMLIENITNDTNEI